jgi:tungstate transport system substrate-binding protein
LGHQYDHRRAGMRSYLPMLVLCLLLGCNGAETPEAAKGPPVPTSSIKLATTTSTDNSGLLGVLLPSFTEETGIAVKVISVGTGKAIRLGEAGDVDVIMVHAAEAEMRFLEQGFGVNRRAVMHNDFVILGPAEDPAGIKGTKEAAEALRKISSTLSTFVSRGDESGTHKKEMALWRVASTEPGGDWYMPIGQGMGAVLTVAEEKGAYTLTDRGTYLAYKGKLSLEVLLEGDPRLFNPYGVIPVNPDRHPHVNYLQAMLFVGWLTSPAGQTLIAEFEIEGERLFQPDAIPLR